MSVSVEICSGTACYIMGGANLLTVADELRVDELKKVEISASTCMDECNECADECPYAKVNGELIPKANMTVLVEKIREAVKLEEGGND